MRYATRQHHPEWKKRVAVAIWRMFEANDFKGSKQSIAQLLGVNGNTVRMWISEQPLRPPEVRKPISLIGRAKRAVGRLGGHATEG